MCFILMNSSEVFFSILLSPVVDPTQTGTVTLCPAGEWGIGAYYKPR